MQKKYKIGDKVYFMYYDGSGIGERTVLGIRQKEYWSESSKCYKTYNELITEYSDRGTPSESIEDYNCLPYSNTKVKEYIKQQKENKKNQSKELLEYVFGTTKTDKKSKDIVNKTIEYLQTKGLINNND